MVRKQPQVPKRDNVDVDNFHSDNSSENEDDRGLRIIWESMEDEIADLVDNLKRKLAQINPGCGDLINLACFVCFVEVNSSSL